MQVQNFLRLRLVFGESKAPTFVKNLEKMIALVLYEEEKTSKQTSGLTIIDIIDRLQSVYGLNFSDSEVLQVIKGKGQNRIICKTDNGDLATNQYTVSAEEYKKLDQQDRINKIGRFVREFLEENTDINIEEREFIEVLNRHFYDVFNSNAEIIHCLLNKEYEHIDTHSSEEFDVSTKEAINRFLYWDNKEKNQCVYSMVSCCFDYCMMTAKQGADSYRSIFNQKTFFLDANIVFRMMGLNHINRKRVIDTFIRKCNEVGVQIRITNHTLQEINETIAHHVRKISSDYGNTEPIDPDALIYLDTLGSTRGFYIAYYEWCKEPSNRIADFRSFENDLKKQAYDILGTFQQRNFDSFAEIDPQRFNSYVESLTNEKKTRGKSTYAAAIATDVNNYMYMSRLNKQAEGSDFFSIHNYLISADHAFCDWGAKIRPSTIPIVVLPSVWYSIMLQFSNRSEDDYASFTSFLNFSMSNTEDTDSKWKLEVLRKIVSINEPIAVKNAMAFEIGEKLKTGKVHDIDSEDVEQIVNQAYQSIIDMEVEKAKEQTQQMNDLKLESFKADVNHEIAKLRNQAEAEVNYAKAETERLKLKVEDQKNDASKNAEIRYKDGQQDVTDVVISKETKRLVKKKYRKYIFWTVIMVIILAATIILPAIYVWNMDELTDGQKEAIDIMKLAVPIATFVVEGLIIGIGFCGFIPEKVEKRARGIIEKRYGYIDSHRRTTETQSTS